MDKFFNLISEAETSTLGEDLSGLCSRQTVIYLHGPLGVGKTTLISGFIKSFGYTGDVKSPTYTLVESYDLCGWQIHHFDLYRLLAPEELEFIGIRDYFTPDSICLIEWPEKGRGQLPDCDIHIYLYSEGEKRASKISGNSEYGDDVLSVLA